MFQLFAPLLTLVLNNGYPIIAAIILVGALGIPLPATATLLIAGSLSADGSLNFFQLILLTTTCAIAGDVLGYALAQGLERKLNLSGKVTFVDSFLKRWGRWTIFLTRFLVTPFGVPVNIAAGISHYPFRRFFVFALSGELLWTSSYIYAGNLMGANWVSVIDYLDTAPQLLALLIIGLGSFYFAFRLYKRRHSF